MIGVMKKEVYIYFPRSPVMNQLGCGARKQQADGKLDDRRSRTVTVSARGWETGRDLHLKIIQMELRHSVNMEDEEYCGSADEEDDF